MKVLQEKLQASNFGILDVESLLPLYYSEEDKRDFV